MPHLEDNIPVNPLLLLQRPETFLPPTRDREEDEDGGRINNQEESEPPLPGSLADGIDRVTLSANARVIAPILPLAETVPVPLELVPGENQVNPAALELLNREARQREVGAPDPRPVDIPVAASILPTGLGELAGRLQAGGEPDEPGPREVLNLQEPPVPLLRNAGAESLANLRAQREPADNDAPLIEDRSGILNPQGAVREINPAAQNGEPTPQTPIEPVARAAAGFRNFGTPAERLETGQETPGDANNRIAPEPAEQPLEQAIAGPAIEATGLTQEPVIPVALPTGTNPGALPRDAEPAEDIQAAVENAINPETPSPARPVVNPLQEPAALTPDVQDNDLEPPFQGPRDAEPVRALPLDPVPELDEPLQSSLIDTQAVRAERLEFQELQRPAFPELDVDELVAPSRDIGVPLDAAPADTTPVEEFPPALPAVANVPPPAVAEEAEPVARPEPGNVEAINENPQALRPDNLGTDPALRGNRELRNFLQEFNNRIEPPEAVTEPAGAPIAEVQNNAPPPPAVFENLEALGAELLESLREQEATEGVTRPEEERTAPPEPRTPETVLTERGQNIDRFI
ncbi:MAG: hypothetical protein IH802_04750 [Nitrospinae bacterium]|nr:hypothetical protein [Nitrospinota bacterium]